MAAKSWSLLTPVVDALKNTICGLIRDVKKHVQTAAGFYAEAQSTPDKTIAIYAGIVYFGITKVEYAGLDVVDLGTSGAFEVSALTADYYNKILFTIDSSGTLAATEGTEHAVAASVVAPAIPAGKFPICMITVQDDGTGTAGTILTIEQSEIQQLQSYAQRIGGDVTAAANLTDEAIVVGDDGAKGVKVAVAGGVAHGFMIDIVQALDAEIVDNDTLALTFAFVPSKIVIEFGTLVMHITTNERGITNGRCVVTITGTDTYTSNLNSVSIVDWNGGAFSSYDNRGETTNIIESYGGFNGTNSGLLIATGAWVTATKTLTLTLQETLTNTANNLVELVATAYA